MVSSLGLSTFLNWKVFFISNSGKINLMSTLSPDTHPKMEAPQIELWRSASPTRKMEMLAQPNQSARLLALAGVSFLYPQIDYSYSLR